MSNVACDVAINLVCVDCGSILHWFQENSPFTDIPVLKVKSCKKCGLDRPSIDTPESIGLAPCQICGSTGFHKSDCALYSYTCVICGARISKRNEFDHVHKPLPLYVGAPSDAKITLPVGPPGDTVPNGTL